MAVQDDSPDVTETVTAGDDPARLAPPPPPASPPGEHAAPTTPRVGEMTIGWRVVTAFTWFGVIVALAAIWSTSVQLGLSTWWLGARAQPRPPEVRLAPFVAPLLMCVATFNNVRRLAYLGFAASAIVAAFGLGDLGRITQLAVLELIVAGLAAMVSIASLSGTYRLAGNGSPRSS